LCPSCTASRLSHALADVPLPPYPPCCCNTSRRRLPPTGSRALRRRLGSSLLLRFRLARSFEPAEYAGLTRPCRAGCASERALTSARAQAAARKGRGRPRFGRNGSRSSGLREVERRVCPRPFLWLSKTASARIRADRSLRQSCAAARGADSASRSRPLLSRSSSSLTQHTHDHVRPHLVHHRLDPRHGQEQAPAQEPRRWCAAPPLPPPPASLAASTAPR